MLESTYEIILKRRKYFEGVIKKYQNHEDGWKKERKIKEAIHGAREIAPYLRNFAFVRKITYISENKNNRIVVYGCNVFLRKEEEEKIVTILGEGDIKYNPRYRNKKRYLGNGDESLLYLGKCEGDMVNGWQIAKIQRFFEE